MMMKEMQLSVVSYPWPEFSIFSLTWTCSGKAPIHPLVWLLSLFIPVCMFVCMVSMPVYKHAKLYAYLSRYQLCLNRTMLSCPFEVCGSVSVFWHWYSKVSHCSMLPTVPCTVRITPTFAAKSTKPWEISAKPRPLRHGGNAKHVTASFVFELAHE